MSSWMLTPSASAIRRSYTMLTPDSYYVKWCPMYRLREVVFQSGGPDLRLLCDLDGGKVR